jgi:hypothetical protein
MNAGGPSLDRVLEAIDSAVPGGARPSGAWHTFRCPCHDDHTASAAAIYNPATERTVVRCWAGCDDRDVLGALGLRVADLYDKPLEKTETPRKRTPKEWAEYRTAIRESKAQAQQRRAQTHAELEARRAELARIRGPQTGPPQLVQAYMYQDVDGRPAGSVLRYITPFERAEVKSFAQRCWNPRDKRYEPGGFPEVLYHLPEVAAAVDAGRTIVLVEGEKDADRARSLGQVATCNAMGADSFTEAHAEQLRGADRVVIIRDRDEPGRRHADHVRDLLANRVRRIDVMDPISGKDLSDHLDAGHRLADLQPVTVTTSAGTRTVAGTAATAATATPPGRTVNQAAPPTAQRGPSAALSGVLTAGYPAPGTYRPIASSSTTRPVSAAPHAAYLSTHATGRGAEL